MQDSSEERIKVSEKTASRKDKHLDLALKSQNAHIDDRFWYEPMMSAHPDLNDSWEVDFGNKRMRFPIWISSMTGGTDKTNEVNRRLSVAAAKFGLGMGVGSARIALEDPARVEDFSLRKFLGDTVPYYLNFGIAQIEKSIEKKEVYKLTGLRDQVGADGFIIHVNPLQEWMQPEGDRIKIAPITTIQRFLDETGGASLIVKEVGQGYGYESMRSLLKLPLTALEFAAAGGTNFSKVELMRNQIKSRFMMPFVEVGHTAGEMIDLLNGLVDELGAERKCNAVIVSGGIKNFLDGYYYIRKAGIRAVYGQASAFLQQAILSQSALNEYIRYQTEGLLLARAFLKIKEK